MAKKKTSVLLPGSISDLVKGLQNGGQPNQNSREEQAAEEREEQHVEDVENKEAENAADSAQQEQAETPASEERPLSPTPDAESESQQAYEEKENSNYHDNVQEPEHDERAYQERQHMEQPAQRNGVIRPANASYSGSASRAGSASYMQGATNREDVQSRRGRRPKAEANAEREYHVMRDDSSDSWHLFLDLAHDYKVGGGKLATIYIDETLKNVLDRLKYAGDEKLPTSAILSSIVARFFYDHEKDIKDVLFKNTLPW